VIIMTTNLGTRDISKGFNLGFAAQGDTASGYERMKNKVQEELKQHFRPEFLNRIDDIVVFHQLSEDEIVQIVDLMIAKLDERLRDKDMGVELTPAAKSLLARKGYDPVLGARPAPDDPARDRGRPVREDPLRGAPARPDRRGRLRGRGCRRALHLHG
jgi:ATP-dependent Clp protease ATP-binding subunit ClpC